MVHGIIMLFVGTGAALSTIKKETKKKLFFFFADDSMY
jgi:hypothetical protein